MKALHREELKNLWAYIKANPLFTALIGLTLIAVIWYFGGSIKQNVQDWAGDRKIERLGKQANDSEQKADAEISEADKASGARAAEDERRRNEILPQLERAARDRGEARVKTQKAMGDYENSKRNLGNADTDLRALRERNSAEYCSVYPDDPDCP